MFLWILSTKSIFFYGNLLIKPNLSSAGKLEAILFTNIRAIQFFNYHILKPI